MRTKFLLLFLFSSTVFAQETLEDVVISATKQELEQKLAPRSEEDKLYMRKIILTTDFNLFILFCYKISILV